MKTFAAIIALACILASANAGLLELFGKGGQRGGGGYGGGGYVGGYSGGYNGGYSGGYSGGYGGGAVYQPAPVTQVVHHVQAAPVYQSAPVAPILHTSPPVTSGGGYDHGYTAPHSNVGVYKVITVNQGYSGGHGGWYGGVNGGNYGGSYGGVNSGNYGVNYVGSYGNGGYNNAAGW